MSRPHPSCAALRLAVLTVFSLRRRVQEEEQQQAAALQQQAAAAQQDVEMPVRTGNPQVLPCAGRGLLHPAFVSLQALLLGNCAGSLQPGLRTLANKHSLVFVGEGPGGG